MRLPWGQRSRRRGQLQYDEFIWFVHAVVSDWNCHRFDRAVRIACRPRKGIRGTAGSRIVRTRRRRTASDGGDIDCSRAGPRSGHADRRGAGGLIDVEAGAGE